MYKSTLLLQGGQQWELEKEALVAMRGTGMSGAGDHVQGMLMIPSLLTPSKAGTAPHIML